MVVQFYLFISSLLLSMHPAIAEIESSAGDVFKTSCMGDEKIDDSAYREQKSKYCDCVADFIYEQQTEMPLMEVIGICKESYPPLS